MLPWRLTASTRRVLHCLAWGLVVASVVVFVLLTTSLDRYFEYDEAVFYSQSGPIGDGANSPASFAPSRELGTAYLIAPFRAVGLGVEQVRIAWLVLALAFMVAAFREIGRFAPPWSGEIGALLFGTFWITGAYLGSFFGSLLAALSMVLATALYLRLQHGYGPAVRLAILLGLTVAVGFSMRGVETAIVVAILIVHSAVWHQGGLWRRDRGSVAIAAATFSIAFVVPWVIHSMHVYGSPFGHLTAWVQTRSEAKTQEHFPIVLHNGVGTWFETLIGRADRVPFNDVPPWAPAVLGAVIFAIVAGVVASVRSPRNLLRHGCSHTGLLALIAMASFGLFFFVVGDPNYRYALYGVAFTAAIGGQFAALVLAGPWRRVIPPPFAVGGLAIVLVGWAAANGAVLTRFDNVRYRVAERDRQAVAVLAGVAHGRPCAVVFPRQTRPQISIATACRTVRVESASGASLSDLISRRARQLEEMGLVPFVVWVPEARSGLGSSWVLVRRISSGSPDRALAVFEPAKP